MSETEHKAPPDVIVLQGEDYAPENVPPGATVEKRYIRHSCRNSGCGHVYWSVAFHITDHIRR